MGRSAEVRVGLQAGGCSLDSARPQRTTRFRSTPTRWPLPGLSRRPYHGFPNETSRRPIRRCLAETAGAGAALRTMTATSSRGQPQPGVSGNGHVHVEDEQLNLFVEDAA